MHFEPSKPGEIVPVPSVLFGSLLERINSLDGLRCALRVIFLLHRKQGKLKYVSTAELVADPVLQWGDGAEAAEQILETFVKFGLLVRVPGGGKNSGCYCLDNMANRRAIARVGKGELPGPEEATVRPREEAIPPRPNIFTLYEDNIGVIYPMAAERLMDIVVEYPEEWIPEAFREAVLHNSRNLKYIEAILRRWRDDGRGTREPGRSTGTVSASEVFRRAKK
ncbi:MAG: DnaD domain protein [Chloroflexota bacterium]|nr:DnaD domain protein [Chloroflexota bacterium]